MSKRDKNKEKKEETKKKFLPVENDSTSVEESNQTTLTSTAHKVTSSELSSKPSLEKGEKKSKTKGKKEAEDDDDEDEERKVDPKTKALLREANKVPCKFGRHLAVTMSINMMWALLILAAGVLLQHYFGFVVLLFTNNLDEIVNLESATNLAGQNICPVLSEDDVDVDMGKWAHLLGSAAFITGLVLLCFSVLGIYGGCSSSKTLLVLIILLLLLSISLQMYLLYLGYDPTVQFHQDVKDDLLDMISKHYRVEYTGQAFTPAINSIMLWHECCGIVGVKDFGNLTFLEKLGNQTTKYLFKVAPACCKRLIFNLDPGFVGYEHLKQCASDGFEKMENLNPQGCYEVVYEHLADNWGALVVIIHLLIIFWNIFSILLLCLGIGINFWLRELLERYLDPAAKNLNVTKLVINSQESIVPSKDDLPDELDIGDWHKEFSSMLLVLATGLIVFSLFGIVASRCKKPVLLLLLTVMLAAGVLFQSNYFLKILDLNSELHAEFQQQMVHLLQTKYEIGAKTNSTFSFLANSIMLLGECCGVISPNDFLAMNLTFVYSLNEQQQQQLDVLFPPACCRHDFIQHGFPSTLICLQSRAVLDINNTGCYHRLWGYISKEYGELIEWCLILLFTWQIMEMILAVYFLIRPPVEERDCIKQALVARVQMFPRALFPHKQKFIRWD